MTDTHSIDGMQTVVFFGSSGSGKGTQAKKLIAYLQENDSKRTTLYIETGQQFREFIADSASYTSQLTANVIDEGGLLPVFLPIWIWTNHLIENYNGTEHLVLDGLARREMEAPVLDSALRFYRRENSHVVYLKTSRDWATERLLERDRDDDSEENIRRRIDWFYENTLPSVNFFRNKVEYDFHEINGEQSIEEVHRDIVNAVFAS